jgi:hypothetical protein
VAGETSGTGSYNRLPMIKKSIRKSARLLWESDFNAETNYTSFSKKLLTIAYRNKVNIQNSVKSGTFSKKSNS